MKNPTLPLLLLLCLFCTCVRAQEAVRPAPIDTSLNIEAPYKLEIQNVGGLFWKSFSIQNARYTLSDGEIRRYCRFHVTGIKATGSLTEDISEISGEQASYLKEDLNRLFVLAKSEKPGTYTSYRNAIGRKVFYTLDYNKLTGWQLFMSVGTDYDKKWFKLPINKLPELASDLEVCIDFTKR